MKIKHGFISNSSSSSFIVIGSSEEYIIPQYQFESNTIYIPSTFGGTTEFGWEIEDHIDIGSRINFCCIQAIHSGNDEWLEMIEKVLKENLKVQFIDFGEIKYMCEKYNAYIDHQSSYPENCEMFACESMLTSFIFDPNSYIHTDNDNY